MKLNHVSFSSSDMSATGTFFELASSGDVRTLYEQRVAAAS
ncbi:hypothetical protein [Paraburkholderia xenovorans]|nr:hypothetical protein [Paraburkholderia xenovorans]